MSNYTPYFVPRSSSIAVNNLIEDLSKRVPFEKLPSLILKCKELAKAEGCASPTTLLLCSSLLAMAYTRLDGRPLSQLDGDWLHSVTSFISDVLEHSRENGDDARWQGFAELWYQDVKRIRTH